MPQTHKHPNLHKKRDADLDVHEVWLVQCSLWLKLSVNYGPQEATRKVNPSPAKSHFTLIQSRNRETHTVSNIRVYAKQTRYPKSQDKSNGMRYYSLSEWNKKLETHLLEMLRKMVLIFWKSLLVRVCMWEIERANRRKTGEREKVNSVWKDFELLNWIFPTINLSIQ